MLAFNHSLNTLGDLIEAMTAAKEEIEKELLIEAVREEVNQGEATEIKADESEEGRGQKFILELVEAGCNETLAYKALEILGPEDVTQGILFTVFVPDPGWSGTPSFLPSRHLSQVWF